MWRDSGRIKQSKLRWWIFPPSVLSCCHRGVYSSPTSCHHCIQRYALTTLPATTPPGNTYHLQTLKELRPFAALHKTQTAVNTAWHLPRHQYYTKPRHLATLFIALPASTLGISSPPANTHAVILPIANTPNNGVSANAAAAECPASMRPQLSVTSDCQHTGSQPFTCKFSFLHLTDAAFSVLCLHLSCVPLANKFSP